MKPAPLHVCPRCASELVYPVHGEESGDHAWRIWRRCPECEWRHEGVFADTQVDLFDRELDRQTAILADALHEAEQANFRAFCERFNRALQLDLIDASDFCVAHA